ncbi:MAG: tripartite tricarboxylate transporter substrate binding protein [Pseudomonadota bacterium]
MDARYLKTNCLGWAVAAFALIAASAAIAQNYPSKPVRLIVSFPPGGPVDIMGRTVAAHVWPGGTPPMIVDNRGGAGGNIGVDLAAKSAPDGYTMVISIVGTLAVSAAIYSKLPYDPARDLAPIAIVGALPGVIVVHPTLPVKNVKELIALAKKHPGELNFGSAGVGTSAHMSGELFKMLAGVKIEHVPYKGNAPAMQDLLGGRLQLMFDYLPASLPFITSGKVRAVAVGGAKRSPQLPGVPTVAESGVRDFRMVGTFGVFVPAGTPREIVAKLNADMNAMLARPEYRERLTRQGAEVPGPGSPADLAAMLKSELVTWAKVVKQSGVRVD